MKRMFHVHYEKPDPKTPGRTIEIPIGVAFTSDRGPDVRIRVDAIPLNWDGSMVIHTDDPVSEMEERA